MAAFSCRDSVPPRFRPFGRRGGSRVGPAPAGDGLGPIDGSTRLRPLARPRRRLGSETRRGAGAAATDGLEAVHLATCDDSDPGWAAPPVSSSHAWDVATTDSPAGLAAWMLEPYVPWVDETNTESSLEADEVIDGVMLHWLASATRGRSRLVALARRGGQRRTDGSSWLHPDGARVAESRRSVGGLRVATSSTETTRDPSLACRRSSSRTSWSTSCGAASHPVSGAPREPDHMNHRTISVSGRNKEWEHMPESPIEVVGRWLQHMQDPDVVHEVIAAGRGLRLAEHRQCRAQQTSLGGPSPRSTAFLDALQAIFSRWDNQAFNVTAMFGDDDNVAVFWNFHTSRTRSARRLLPRFSIHVRVAGGKVTYVQFLEDTYATARSLPQRGHVDRSDRARRCPVSRRLIGTRSAAAGRPSCGLPRRVKLGRSLQPAMPSNAAGWPSLCPRVAQIEKRAIAPCGRRRRAVDKGWLPSGRRDERWRCGAGGAHGSRVAEARGAGVANDRGSSSELSSAHMDMSDPRSRGCPRPRPSTAVMRR